MNRVPKVGERVRFVGSVSIGPCVGTVTKVYPSELFSDDFYEDPDAIAGVTHKPLGLAPEREWHVAMKPDALPERWPYTGSDQFAPDVASLRKVQP